MSRFSARSLFAELRRRRVFNTALLYVVGAWGALQVSELGFPALDIPDRAIRWVWLAAFALLPLVLVFAWRYDISTGGIRRTAPPDAPDEAERGLLRPDRWLIGSISVIAIGVLSIAGYRITTEEPLPEVRLEVAENRVAVLPFQACPGGITAADLTHSLAGEVISRLAERDFVEVIGGNSSFWLADQGLLPVEIADQLSVNYLLSGNLCDAEGELTLDFELSEAQGGIQMRERLTEAVNEFGQVEQRLSAKVAQRVAAEFGDVLPASVATAVRQDALLAFRMGREWRRQGRRGEARKAFEQALELQPDYADALYALAQMEHTTVLSNRKQEHFERARPLLERALDMARRQLRLDPRSAQAHYTIGSILADLAQSEWELAWRAAESGEARDPDAALAEAEQHLRQAISADPTLLAAYLKLVDTIRDDRPQERLEILERAAGMEPFSVGLARRQAEVLLSLGRYPEAMEALHRIREPLEVPAMLWHSRFESQWANGRYDEAFRTLVRALQYYPPGALYPSQLSLDTVSFAAVLAHLGLHEAAERWWNETSDFSPRVEWVRLMLRSWYLCASGRAEKDAAEWAERLRDKSEQELLQAHKALVSHYAIYLVNAGNPEGAIRLLERMRPANNLKDSLWLAYLYREIGQAEVADRALDAAVRGLEDLRAAGFRDSFTLYSLAQAYALQDRRDAALSALAQAYDYHAYPNSWDRVAPWYRPFAGLEGDPGYEALQERLQLDLERQARSIERMLEGLDLDSLFLAIRPSESGGGANE